MSRDRRSRGPANDVVGVFTAGQTHPFVDYQPYLGGVIRIISNVAANTATAIAHTLHRNPLSMEIVYAHGVYTPKWQDTAAWDAANIHVEFDTAIPALPAFIVVLIK